ncbi:MAG: signal peptidase I [Firmicutes bacterium]|nr:signal peptidase I [Bacillota bacterium]
MSNQNESGNAAVKKPPQDYKLPYPNAAVEAFVEVANNALAQVRTTEDTCRRAMTVNENTTVGVLPTFPQLQDSFAPGIIASTKSLLLTAESCCQAQNSVCEALASGLATAEDQRSKLLASIAEVEGEIKKLNGEANRLRKNVTDITDDPNANDAYATSEAKKLLDVLEDAYRQHSLRKALQQHLNELNANLDYLHAASDEAADYVKETETLLRRAEDEWHRIVSLFGVSEERAKDDLLRSEVLAPAPPAEEKAAPPEPEERPSAWSTIWTYIKIVAVAFLIAVVLRAYCFDVTMVEGSSMYPTLKDGDNLITSKITYVFNEPERGDIIVLKAPDSPGDDYIKRVIGLPDDHLKIEDGRVYINDKLLDEPYLNGIYTEGDEDLIIPSGYYFVMGDNRDESRDSRTDKVGPISRNSIVGKSVFRLFPLSGFGRLNKDQ